MARQRVRVEGLKKLDKALKELPKATARNVVKRVLLKAGKPIEDAARRLAPERLGHLKKGIGRGTKLTKTEKKRHRKRSDVEVFVGASHHPQAEFQEFGTVHSGPQPFLRPAWDANKRRALDSVKGDLSHEIAKAAERARRKALKAKR